MNALIRSDLKQRTRGKRWWILLALWTLLLLALLAFVRSAAVRSQQFVSIEGQLRQAREPVGPTMFGSLMLFTLILACLIVPSLTSTTINGERERGTFAVLQATMLRPWEIFFAKFFSALATTGAFLLATVPLTLWCLSEGGVDVTRVVVTYLILVLLCAVLLAVGLMTSTFLRRPALSAVASYGVVFALTLGSLIIFGLSLVTAPTEEVTIEVRRGPDFTTEQQVIGWRWLLLAPNPFVVLADAAPRREVPRDQLTFGAPDPLAAIRDGARAIRRPPEMQFGGRAEVVGPEEEPPAVWPAGMAIELALALGAGYLTIRRLRIPAHRLAPGQRVA